MKIDKVMIAGMDNKTSILGLEKLKERFPFVEWGVLFTKNKAGRQRYPDFEYIKELCASNTGNMSAHFCGAYPREILEQGDFEELAILHPKFDAIQLNYNFARTPDKWSLINVIKFLKICEELDIDVILQNNKSNSQMVDKMKSFKAVRILHDASGGRGTEIKTIEAPTWEAYTGFAGGINEDNIERIMSTIRLHPSEKTVWIDLESGARTDNEFDLRKVYRILEIAEKQINK